MISYNYEILDNSKVRDVVIIFNKSIRMVTKSSSLG